ncbi:MAG: acyl-CoA thioesterase [Oscillospiraceae bacterium]|nr:acyl-CoA thioesterase [Oscillospiraceae bacterium]
MVSLKRKINYYETDRMGITHHSNYVRFMEEGRVHFLEKNGCPFGMLEEIGIISPVISIDCRYKDTTTFDDEIEIEVEIAKYNGFKIGFEYVIRNCKNGKIAFSATSEHCFLSTEGKLLRLNYANPDLHARLLALLPDK